jgi:hypothetical protein
MYNESISVLEAIIIGGVSIIGYVMGKTIYQHYFKK